LEKYSKIGSMIIVFGQKIFLLFYPFAKELETFQNFNNIISEQHFRSIIQSNIANQSFKATFQKKHNSKTCSTKFSKRAQRKEAQF
jgi:hypothetical protein